MANEEVLDQAARLDEIGFPEFTAKLVGDTFDALVMANIKQTRSYIELLQEAAKSLSTYVNETRDDATSGEVLAFLAAILPAAASDADHDSTVYPGKELTAGEADALNTALAVPADVDPQPLTYAATNVVSPTDKVDPNDANSPTQWQALLDAIAVRIAANKYTLLQRMVEQGVLRLVVENGTIETRMTFKTFGSSAMTRNTSDYVRNRTNKRSGSGSGFLPALFFTAGEKTNAVKLRVTTTKESNRDISGSSVQIYGGVTINFKTDYQPLS